MGFDLGALLRNAAGPAADVMAAHKRRDASLAEKQQQLALQAVAAQRQASQDDLQRRIGESTITRNNRAPAAPVVAPVHWERFEARGGLYERNPVTHEVRPIREPVETETPTAPMADEGQGEQQMGARQAGDQQTGDIDLRTPPSAPAPKPTLPPILQPKPPAPRAAPGPEGLKEVMRNGKRVWVRESNAVGQEAPSPEPRADPLPTIVTGVNPDGTPAVFRVPKESGPATPVEGIAPKPTGGAGIGMAAIKKAVAANEVTVAMIDRALAELEGHPDAVGLKRGVPFIGEDINQRADSAGVNTRALIANVGSAKIHDRTGAAMTAKEEPRLMPFIPGIRDNNSAAAKKLRLLREFTIQENEALQRGGQPSQGGGRGGGAGATGGAAGPVNLGEEGWAKANPPRAGESFDQYHARYLASKGGE